MSLWGVEISKARRTEDIRSLSSHSLDTNKVALKICLKKAGLKAHTQNLSYPFSQLGEIITMLMLGLGLRARLAQEMQAIQYLNIFSFLEDI